MSTKGRELMRTVNGETMTRARTVNGATMTRVEEMDRLREFMEQMKGGYVGSLLTPALLTELAARMNNDFTCDVFGELRDLETEAEKLRRQATEYDHLLQAAQQAQLKAENTLEAARKAHAAERQKLDDGLRSYDNRVFDLEQSLTQEQDRGLALAVQIRELKAELYDWMIGAKRPKE